MLPLPRVLFFLRQLNKTIADQPSVYQSNNTSTENIGKPRLDFGRPLRIQIDKLKEKANIKDVQISYLS